MSDFTPVTIPAGSVEPIAVTFDEPFERPPKVVFAYEGPDELLDRDPVMVSGVTASGFHMWSEIPLDEDLEVQWLAQSTD